MIKPGIIPRYSLKPFLVGTFPLQPGLLTEVMSAFMIAGIVDIRPAESQTALVAGAQHHEENV